MNVDDIVSDLRWDLLKQLWESATLRSEIDMEYSDVPEDIQDQWYDELWNIDVSKWEPKDDERALPGTHYDNYLGDVLEFNCYEIRSKMIEYLRKKTKRNKIYLK